jgi:hypothetical protein
MLRQVRLEYDSVNEFICPETTKHYFSVSYKINFTRDNFASISEKGRKRMIKKGMMLTVTNTNGETFTVGLLRRSFICQFSGPYKSTSN